MALSLSALVCLSLSACLLLSLGQPNTLWVSEQIPGHFTMGDQTMVLQRGYWPSYNVPFYEDIYNLSGYPAVAHDYGPTSSYQVSG
jgi:hypothetical protein